ncbi:MAG: bifunctional phosphoglucose/phosphomannose isomerase [Patescibacteria group bacterium]
MMRDAILNFPKQFLFNPQIQTRLPQKKYKSFVFSAIGGSLLAGRLVKAVKPEADITLHGDYGLPPLPADKLKQSLFLIVSYSGNTEEPLDTLKQALKNNYNCLAISTGGTLLELAREYNIPYIKIPNTGIQPRMALGFNFRAILKAMGEQTILRQSSLLAITLDLAKSRELGKKLAKKLINYIPVIYSSTSNQALAYGWKIKLNETGKIPAFYNILPEMNHNEMTGFDVVGSTRSLSKKFYFIFLLDDDDNERIQTRMEVLEKLYRDRKFPVKIIKLQGNSRPVKVFSSLLLADWTAYYTAQAYGVESEQVPMVEEFKKKIII